LKGGEPAKVVSERLGHSSVAITLDIYSHADPGLQKGLADRLAAMVDGEKLACGRAAAGYCEARRPRRN
jgi:hypothetical protein